MAAKSSSTSPSPSTAEKYVPAVERKAGWDSYDVKDALQTLSRADQIRKNKPFMAEIKKEAVRQLKVAQATATQLQGGK